MKENTHDKIIDPSEVRSTVEKLLPVFQEPLTIGLYYWNLENKQHIGPSEMMDSITREFGEQGYQMVLATFNSYAMINRLSRLENISDEVVYGAYVEVSQPLFHLTEQIRKIRNLENEIKKLENTINMLVAQANFEKEEYNE